MSTNNDAKKGLSSDKTESGIEDSSNVQAPPSEARYPGHQNHNIGCHVDNHQAVLEHLESSQENHGQTFVQFNRNTKVDGTPKLHKPDFPKIITSFHGYRVLEEEKVWMAPIHLLDAAHTWYMHIEWENGTPSWRSFTKLLNLRFGPLLCANPLGDLVACRCRHTGLVTDYSEQTK
jgi:hypothetical protein